MFLTGCAYMPVPKFRLLHACADRAKRLFRGHTVVDRVIMNGSKYVIIYRRQAQYSEAYPFFFVQLQGKRLSNTLLSTTSKSSFANGSAKTNKQR